MFVGDLYVNACTISLPVETTSYRAAARSGLIESPDRSIGDPDVPIFHGDSPIADMAADALNGAIGAADADPTGIGFLLHCAMWHQGFDIWSAAHYVADQAGCSRAIPVNIAQGCNGAMAGLELMVRILKADSAIAIGAITASDAMLMPRVDRWNLNYGCVNGDAGSAFLVARQPSERHSFRLLAIASVAASELELMHRCGLPPTTGPALGADGRVSLKTTKKAFLEQVGSAEFSARSNESLLACVREALDDSGLGGTDPRIKGVSVPRLSGSVFDSYREQLEPVFGSATIHWWGDKTGHLSCTDVSANIDEMYRTLDMREGDVCLVVNAGAGYTWSCVILEFVR